MKLHILSMLLYVALGYTVFGEEPLRIVATGGRMGHDTYGPLGSAAAFRHRTPHLLGGPVDEIQIGFMNWSHNYTQEVVSTNDINIEYAWLERESTGQVVPLTFNGNRQFVMPANSLDAYFPADVIASSVWTGSSPAQDEVFWVNIKGSFPVGSVVYTGTPATWSGAKFTIYAPADDPGTYDTTGPVPAISGANSRFKGIPLVFAGRYSEPGHLAVIGIGDSILQGSGDAERIQPAITGFGFFSRAAVDENGTHAIAMFNLTRHGATSSCWNNPIRMPHFLPLANVVVEEFGTNDIGSNASGANTGAVKTRLENLWTRARNAGVQYILRTPLMPRATSTDSFSSKEGQTPNLGWGEGGARDIMNTFFDTALSGGVIDGVVKVFDAIADPTDTHYWLSNGTSSYVTGDGTHPNVSGCEKLAPVLRAALLSLDVALGFDTYRQWSDRVDWQGADSSLVADPNQDGVSNLMAYALDLPAMATVNTTNRPSITLDEASADGPWLIYNYRRNPTASDISYSFMRNDNLSAAWSSISIDGTQAVEETVNANPDGDGSAALMRLRVKVAPDTEKMFLKMQVSL
ncbi:MAG: SGNH/GDSL hydrolase family protein [Kiritimatiellales bacterium]|nr:SGNH/GDSL hydrolase family protein [Kiritimatiellales bacterium]